jgi:hypothetical protein
MGFFYSRLFLQRLARHCGRLYHGVNLILIFLENFDLIQLLVFAIADHFVFKVIGQFKLLHPVAVFEFVRQKVETLSSGYRSRGQDKMVKLEQILSLTFFFLVVVRQVFFCVLLIFWKILHLGKSSSTLRRQNRTGSLALARQTVENSCAEICWR